MPVSQNISLCLGLLAVTSIMGAGIAVGSGVAMVSDQLEAEVCFAANRLALLCKHL